MWITPVIGSIITSAIADILLKKMMFGTKISTYYSLFFANLFNSLIALVFVFFGREFNFQPYLDLWVWVLFSVLVSTAAIFAYIQSFRVKSISISIIIISSSAVFSSILSFLFLGQSLSLLQILGTVLVFLSVLIVAYRNVRLEKNHIWALICAVLLGVWFTIDGYIVGMPNISGNNFLFTRSMAATIFLIVFTPFKFIRETKKYKNILHLASIPQVFYGLYYVCIFYAFFLGAKIAIVDSLNNIYILLVIFWEYFFDRQREGLSRKIVATLFAVLGVYLLAFI